METKVEVPIERLREIHTGLHAAFATGDAEVVTQYAQRAIDWYVECGDCTARGGIGEGELDALQEWNRRALEARIEEMEELVRNVLQINEENDLGFLAKRLDMWAIGAKQTLSATSSDKALVDRERLREIEWACMGSLGPECPVCEALKDGGRHEEDCWLAAMLGGGSDMTANEKIARLIGDE